MAFCCVLNIQKKGFRMCFFAIMKSPHFAVMRILEPLRCLNKKNKLDFAKVPIDKEVPKGPVQA